MIKYGKTALFTDEDKKHMIVKRYNELEIKNNENKYKTKRNNRRLIFGLILFVLILLFYLTKHIVRAYILTGSAIIFVIFLILLYEYIDKGNLKAISNKIFYVEAYIEKILPIEPYMIRPSIIGTIRVSNVYLFYPIRGRDTTSGYKSIYYIDEEEYDNANVGEKVRVSFGKNLAWTNSRGNILPE